MGGRGLSLEALNKDEADGVPPRLGLRDKLTGLEALDEKAILAAHRYAPGMPRYCKPASAEKSAERRPRTGPINLWKNFLTNL